jgi:hypothetical protein
MSCEHLICAQCAGPVAEGRCPVCHAARARMHHHGGPSMTLPLVALALIAVLLMIAALHLVH